MEELAELVARERELHEKIKGLKAEKDALRNRIRELTPSGSREVTTGSSTYKLRVAEEQYVWDESKLRQILRAEYDEVLIPDAKKIRQNRELAEKLLRPSIGILGRPDTEKVKAALTAMHRKGELPSREIRSSYVKRPGTLYITRLKR